MKNTPLELLLLTTNLSQMKDAGRVIELCIDSLRDIFPGCTFRWAEHEEAGADNRAEVCTRNQTFGYIMFTCDEQNTESAPALIHNAGQMLAVILEKINQEQQLVKQNRYLNELAQSRAMQASEMERRVAERTAELEAANKTLRDSRLAALNMMEDAVEDRQRIENSSIALRKSEELLKQSQRIAGVGHYNIDMVKQVLTGSEMLETIYGIDLTSTNPLTMWAESIPPDHQDEIKKYLTEHVLKHHVPFDKEYQIKRINDGVIRWVHGLGNLEYDNAGKPVRMFGTIQDITARKEAEAKEQNITNILNETGEIGKIGGWELDLVTGISTWTNETYRIFEVDPSVKVVDEIPQKPKGVDYYAPEFRQIIGQAVQRAIEFGEPYDLEVVLITEKGNRRWVRTNGRLKHRDGHKILSGAMQDITERKLAEEAIATEKERLAVTLRSIGDGVITTDTLGNVVIMNKVAEELTGWKQIEAQGHPLAEVFNIINEATRQPCENPVVKVLATGDSIELANHTVLVSRDGTERIIADSGAPIRDTKSLTIGVVLVFRDMTEKQRLLDTIQRTDKLDSLGVLAGGIAHDFNNLLGGIFGYIDLARAECADQQAVAEYLDKAFTVFNRAKDLTQQLLTFSKGGAPTKKAGKIGVQIKESTSFALSGSNVACEYHIPDDLWLCEFDENQIGQVIDNIVINAQQAMPLGGKIVVSAHNKTVTEREIPLLHSGDYVQISIADTGVGIPPNLLKRIFDPFFTTKQKGNGLGLATCYSIIRKHDGAIEIESEPGKGSVFHLYLPASTKEAAGPNSPYTFTHTGSGTILVMDDELYIREVVGMMLKRMGYTIIEAKDGAEALQCIAQAKQSNQPIDAAIFDLTIPGGLGGKEAVIELRKSNTYLLVFASSGFSEDPVMAKPAEFGFSGSIRKPYRKEDLGRLLEKYLRKK
jgi:PAS domain S-box-containing protein